MSGSAHSGIFSIIKKIFLPGKTRKHLTRVDIENFGKIIGYRFRNEKLILQALKHRSYLTETKEPRIESNERLELLGDAVLGLVVTEYLYRKYPNDEEGTLTMIKSLVVSRRVITQVGLKLNFGDYILLNDGEIRSGGRRRPSIISDTYEAIVGAIYLDGGLEPARTFIVKYLLAQLDEIVNSKANLNYKSLLLEHCQSVGLGTPVYVVVEEQGPDHEKLFTINAKVNGDVLGTGKGRSKKKAEQQAAKYALQKLKPEE